MAGARVLADGKTKFTILITEPADPGAPTVTELLAGIDVQDDVLTSDFNWTATDSEKIAEKALSAKNNANAIGSGNYTAGLTLWRKYDPSTGAPDMANEPGWEAVKEKGTELWCYARESGKDPDVPWAEMDEIYLGGHVINDTPQKVDGTGFIKRRIPLEPQTMYDNIVVAAAGV
ncbi:hypothetical protein [Arthrobacter sp. JSM 101049]|uniref:phage tail tube protein n=1 Tax=Arthrobacter sp. JSM 101049 TaxID=929097 RepID=UPI003568610F